MSSLTHKPLEVNRLKASCTAVTGNKRLSLKMRRLSQVVVILHRTHASDLIAYYYPNRTFRSGASASDIKVYIYEANSEMTEGGGFCEVWVLL